MQHHAASLARRGLDVRVVAYGGEAPHAVVAAAGARLHPVASAEAVTVGWVPRPAALAVRVAAQLLHALYLMLLVLPPPRAALLQVPPSVPSLAALRLALLVRGGRLVVDWHNLGYTLLALRLGDRAWLVRALEAYERRAAAAVARTAGHVAVSRALRDELARSWGIPDAAVLRDRPAAMFRPASVEEAHALFARCGTALQASAARRVGDCCDAAPAAQADGEPPGTRTLVTEVAWTGEPRLRADRPAVLVSGTSWTPDEDFGVLLAAAEVYDARCTRSHPPLLVVVTGKGPQREAYEARMRASGLANVAFRTAWLDAADYPTLLGAADLGVSLHTSSSGLDLPMKVVDMFGCGLPVLAARYPTMGELVHDGEDGLLFGDAEELAGHLLGLLKGFPRRTPQLDALRAGVGRLQATRWDEAWDEAAAPLFGL